VTETFVIEILDSLLFAVEVFRSGSEKHSARVAEAMINCIDAELSERPGYTVSRDISTYPEIDAELLVQTNMLEYLESFPVLQPDDVNRFRP
jgi:hypothetical protein